METDEAIRQRLAARRPTLDVDAAWRAFERRRSLDGRTRRRRRRGVVAAALVLLVGAGAGAVVARSGDGAPSLRTGPSARSEHAPDTWRRLAEGPLSAGSHASAVWTGSEVLIAGGTDARPCPPGAGCTGEGDTGGPLRDGAAYDPATDTWRTIAAAPAAFEVARTLWTGELMLVYDQSEPPASPRLLAYEPRRDTWEQRSVPPRGGGGPFGEAAWTGELAVLARMDGTGGDWTYDPATDSWAELPADPIGCAHSRTVVAAPGSLILFAVTCGDTENVDPPRDQAARFDLATQRWRRLPGSDIAAGSNSWIVTGDLVVNPSTLVADGGGEVEAPGQPYPLGGVLDLATEVWSRPTAIDPPDEGERASTHLGYQGPAGAWVVTEGRLYEPVTGPWHVIPPGPEVGGGRAAAWTGQEIVAWGGTDEASEGHLATGAAYTPPEPPG